MKLIVGKNVIHTKKTTTAAMTLNKIFSINSSNNIPAITPVNRANKAYTNIFYKFCASGIIIPSAVNNKDYNKN
ncbi:MAG: hypothetical protein J6L86_08025 [Alphaproteobacteria bacterium]|nr:hypothetical protein [Alphaproteobacteria bacterium]